MTCSRRQRLALYLILMVVGVGCSLPRRFTTTAGWRPGEPVEGHFIAGTLIERAEGVAYLSGLAGIAKGEFEGWKYFVRVKGNPGNVNLYGHARVSREAEGTVVVEQELSNMWRPLSLRYEATSHEGSEKFLLAGGEYDLGSGRFFLMDMTSDSVQVRQISFPLTVSYRPGDYVAVRRTWKGGKERTHVHGFYRGDGHQHSELPGLKRAETIEVPGWNPEDDQHSEFPGLELARAMESAVTESRQFLSEGLNEVLTSHR